MLLLLFGHPHLMKEEKRGQKKKKKKNHGWNGTQMGTETEQGRCALG